MPLQRDAPWIWTALSAIAIFLAAQVVFWPALDHAPTLDSKRFLIGDERVATRDLGAIFSTDWWARDLMGTDADRGGGGGLYRPVALAWIAYCFEPPTPQQTENFGRSVQRGNVFLHGLVAALFLLLATRSLGGTRGALFGSLAAALVVTLHPVAIETVGTAVGAAEGLAAAFGLLALLALQGLPGPRWLSPVVGGLAALCAMLSKEHAIVLPALALLQGLWIQRLNFKLALLRALPVIAAALVTLLLRMAVLGGLTDPGDPVLQAFPFGAQFATALAVIGGPVLRILFWPVDLNPLYNLQDVPPASSLSDPRALTGLCVLLSVVAAIVVGLEKNRRLAFGFAFFLLVFLPVSNLLVPIGALAATRFLYLPAFGLAFALALLFKTILGSGTLTRRIACALLALGLAVPAAIQARTELGFWRSDATLFAHAAGRWPQNLMLRHYRILEDLRATDQLAPDNARRKAGFESAYAAIEAAYELPLPEVPGKPGVVQEDLLDIRYQVAMNGAITAQRLETMALLQKDADAVLRWREAAQAYVQRAVEEAQRGLAQSKAGGRGETNWSRWLAEAYLRRIEFLMNRVANGEAEKNRERQVFDAQLARARAASPDHLRIDLVAARLVMREGDPAATEKAFQALQEKAAAADLNRLGRAEALLACYERLRGAEQEAAARRSAATDDDERARADALLRRRRMASAELFLAHFEEGLWRESPKGPAATRLAEHGLVGLDSRHPKIKDLANRALRMAMERADELPPEALMVLRQRSRPALPR